MRRSPSIVPHEANQDTYLVLDDFGRMGCSWRETAAESADRETLIRDLVEGRSASWASTPPKAGPVT
jgi:hypothetical protein